MSFQKEAEVMTTQVAKIDLLNHCIVKEKKELSTNICEKISKINRELTPKEVFDILVSGGSIYTISYCFKII